MFRLLFIHIVLFFVVHMTNRRNTKPVKEGHANKDLIRSSFEDVLGFKGVVSHSTWVHLLITLLPIYFYIHKPSIAEHVCVVYIYHLCIRAIQNKINPHNPRVDFHLPFFVL